VEHPRIQSIFERLLADFGITEPVMLCVDIPLDQKNFAEVVRRSDGRAIVAISHVLLQFNDEEVMGMLAHELAHLVARDPERPRAANRDDYLREEHQADIKAAEVVGRGAVCAAVRRAYRASVALGFDSSNGALRWFCDRRLKWIAHARSDDPAPQCRPWCLD
jgi:Zn-dependent protease with chaperone function